MGTPERFDFDELFDEEKNSEVARAYGKGPDAMPTLDKGITITPRERKKRDKEQTQLEKRTTRESDPVAWGIGVAFASVIVAGMFAVLIIVIIKIITLMVGWLF